MNQCDGCRRGLPLEDDIHVGDGYDMIGCTKEQYMQYTKSSFLHDLAELISEGLDEVLHLEHFAEAVNMVQVDGDLIRIHMNDGTQYKLVCEENKG